jgi:hypothetical protein
MRMEAFDAAHRFQPDGLPDACRRCVPNARRVARGMPSLLPNRHMGKLSGVKDPDCQLVHTVPALVQSIGDVEVEFVIPAHVTRKEIIPPAVTDRDCKNMSNLTLLQLRPWQHPIKAVMHGPQETQGSKS